MRKDFLAFLYCLIINKKSNYTSKIVMTEKDLKVISSVIDKEKEFFNSVSQNIWNSPELSFQEIFAHNILTDALTKFGFCVQRNYFLQTAFRAEFSTGDSPTIAVLLEYDALPEIGHACGHNLIAETGLAAALGIKTAMESNTGIKGKLVVLGCPAEESGGGKVKLIQHGAFDGIDAAMMAHPDSVHWFDPVAICLLSLSVDYKGKESHASAFPWEGVNALDAAVTLYQSLGLLRQQMKPSYRLHAIITKGGTVPNIIPAESSVEIYIRVPTKKELLPIKSKVEKCIEGAALSTGCTYTINYDSEDSCDDLVTNKTMCEIFTKFAEKFGLRNSKDLSVAEGPLGSTDMGNVSYVVPSIHPYFDINTNSTYHTEEFTAASGSPDAQSPTLNVAKAMAMTALSLMRDPQKLDQAKTEFKDQTTIH